MSKIILDSIKQKIVELYTNKNSTRRISQLLNISRYVVLKTIKESKVCIRSMSEAAQEHLYDSNYFDTINTERKAYWLGLLYADGNVCIKGKKRLQITLQKEDEYLLIELLKDLGAGKIYNDRVYSKIIINNSFIVDSLIKLGCVPIKSLILKFPTEEQVPKELQNHFIRGYFDGDGSCVYNNKQGQTLTFTSVESFLTPLKNIVEKEKLTFQKFYIRYKNKELSAGSMSFYQNSKNPILSNYLYKNATIFMKRKHKKIHDHIKNYNENIYSRL